MAAQSALQSSPDAAAPLPLGAPGPQRCNSGDSRTWASTALNSSSPGGLRNPDAPLQAPHSDQYIALPEGPTLLMVGFMTHACPY